MKNRGVGQVKAGVIKLSSLNAMNLAVCEKVEKFIRRYVMTTAEVHKIFLYDIDKGLFRFGGQTIQLGPNYSSIEIKLDYYSHEIVVYCLNNQSRISITFEQTFALESHFCDNDLNMLELFTKLLDIYQPIYSLSTITETKGVISKVIPTAGDLVSISYHSVSNKSTIVSLSYKAKYDSETEEIADELITIKYYDKDNDIRECIIDSHKVYNIQLSNHFINIYPRDEANTKIKILHDTPV